MSKHWLVAIIAVLAFALPAVAKTSDEKEDKDEGSKMGLSQGVDLLLEEVYTRQKALTLAEREIAQRESAVVELEALVDARITTLETSRQEIEDRIAAWETKGGSRVQKLSKIYSAMPAAKAATLLTALDLDLSVEVLSKMKQKYSAQILASMPAARALSTSERMVRPLSAPPASGE
ncbi:MAG: flagellar motility protein MotE (MotC chaperone), partial [Myxococcota bacterium]